MNHFHLIDEGNDDDFGEPEYEWGGAGKTLAAAEQQAQFRAQAEARFVRLADELSEAFPTTEAVNDALRQMLRERRMAA